MDIRIEYWHWLVLGMVLIIAEIFIPSFTVLWFGLAGILVAVILLLIPDLAVSWQLFVWAVAAGVCTFLWFKYFKPLMIDRTKAGISREAVLGEIGLVIKVPVEDNRGLMRFSVPLLGSDEWPFICKDQVAVGDRVAVSEVSGNTLIVEKR